MYLTQGLRRAQQFRPKATSTVFRGRRRTWSETAERVARLAGGLKAAGVRPGDRVAILALNSDRYFELMAPARKARRRRLTPPQTGRSVPRIFLWRAEPEVSAALTSL
jgi:acyl-CoA synthetase (AMP-forming)/AMP-acid ligase II